MRILWVTSCAADMWVASGRALLKSFIETQTYGEILLCYEGIDKYRMQSVNDRLKFEYLDNDEFLHVWLNKFRNQIPVHLGGTVEEPLCKCPGGPYEPHSKKHRMPCIGHWFNKNHSRWFRKVAGLKIVLERHVPQDHVKDTAVIWIDSDCRFKRKVEEKHVRDWFNTKGVFYLKHTRPVMEAGIVGYNLGAGGGKVITEVIDTYYSGAYQKYERWDDSFVIQKVLFEKCPDVKSVDLAYGLGAHAGVVEQSALGAFITHDKGRHGRKLGLMT